MKDLSHLKELKQYDDKGNLLFSLSDYTFDTALRLRELLLEKTGREFGVFPRFVNSLDVRFAHYSFVVDDTFIHYAGNGFTVEANTPEIMLSLVLNDLSHIINL
jgi:hypothetical protein